MSATALTLTYGNHSPLCHLLTRGNNLEARSAQATSAKETTVASEHRGLRSHSEDATRAFPILAQTSPALISSHLQLAVNRAAAWRILQDPARRKHRSTRHDDSW